MSSESNHIVSETDLIKECIAGNRKMQELLYNRYSAKMYAVCLRYSGNSEDAQDLLQEGFVKIFLNLNKYRGEGSFEGWIRRIFVNTAIEYFRRQHKITPVSETQENTFEDKDWNTLNIMGERDIINIVQRLSPGYRQVFNMYVIEGYSHKEIADILGISEGTSKSQLARAKILLKKIIETNLLYNK